VRGIDKYCAKYVELEGNCGNKCVESKIGVKDVWKQAQGRSAWKRCCVTHPKAANLTTSLSHYSIQREILREILE
jgi:hypothetical protein